MVYDPSKDQRNEHFGMLPRAEFELGLEKLRGELSVAFRAQTDQVSVQFNALQVGLAKDFAELKADNRNMRNELQKINQRIEKIEKDIDEKEETTGVHNLNEIKAERDAAREGARRLRAWLLGILSALIVLAISGLVGYVFWQVVKKPAALLPMLSVPAEPMREPWRPSD